MRLLDHSRNFGLLLCGLTLAFGSLSPRAAHADERAVCIAAAERGQKSRKEGKLPDAQKDFLTCARSECPPFVRTDCSGWLNEVIQVMPSIVVAARMNGKDLFDVRVIIDGQVVTEKLDGKGIPTSTGEHILRFEYGNEPAIETKVLMREGDKNRAIDVAFGTKDATTRPTSPTSPTSTTTTPETRSHTVFPWIVVGLGGATAVTGVVLMIVGGNDFPAECNKDTGTCQRGVNDAETDDRRARAESAHGLQNLGLGLLVGGAVVAAGGLAWHFLEPTGPDKAKEFGARRWQVAPSIGQTTRSLVFSGEF